jgi:hypothetical protein
LTLQAYADAKRIPLKTLLTYGVSDLTLTGNPAVHIPYRDRDGHEPAIRLRMALDGDSKFQIPPDLVVKSQAIDIAEFIWDHSR